MFIAVLLILICAPFAWWYLNLRKYKSLDVIPGPKPLPIVGNSYDLGSSPQELFHNVLDLFKQYGDVFKVYVGSELKVFVANAELLEQIMSSNIHIVKSDGYFLFKAFLRTGLLTSTGEKWKIRRKMITPTFHFKILDQFLEVFNASADILAQKLSSDATNKPFDLYPYINLFSLDVVCETAMGVKISSQQGKNVEYVSSLRNYLDIFMVRFFSAWKRLDTLFRFAPEYNLHEKYLDRLQTFSSNIIKKRREEKAKEGNIQTTSEDGIKRRVALLDMLLESEDSRNLTNDDIKEEINTFMFEGHDTTTSGICFTLMSLGNYPEIQQRVYEEVLSVVGDDQFVTMQQLQDVKYLEMVIKETERKYASVPFVERKLDRDSNLGGIDFPKDTTLTLYIHGVHHNEKYYTDPDKFDPDRFLPEKQAERHNYAFVPFSAGPRNCIGQKFAMMDMKVAVIKILQKYEIVSVPNYKPELGMAAILKSYNGIMIKLKSRSKQ